MYIVWKYPLYPGGVRMSQRSVSPWSCPPRLRLPPPRPSRLWHGSDPCARHPLSSSPVPPAASVDWPPSPLPNRVFVSESPPAVSNERIQLARKSRLPRPEQWLTFSWPISAERMTFAKSARTLPPDTTELTHLSTTPGCTRSANASPLTAIPRWSPSITSHPGCSRALSSPP